MDQKEVHFLVHCSLSIHIKIPFQGGGWWLSGASLVIQGASGNDERVHLIQPLLTDVETCFLGL